MSIPSIPGGGLPPARPLTPPPPPGGGNRPDQKLIDDAIAALRSGSLATFLEGLTPRELARLEALVLHGRAGLDAPAVLAVLEAEKVRRART